MSPSLILADDHPLILNGTKTYLENLGYNVIGTALDGQKAYNKIVQLKPDIALLDYDMPKLNGIEIAEEVKRNKLHCKIIILTLHKQVSLIKEVGKTIHGYITKDSALEEFETCIATILKGESYIGSKLDKSIPFAIEKNTRLNLTKAEKKILNLLNQNLSSLQIAESLFISKRTVEKHRSNIIKKLQLDTTNQNALIIWIKQHPEIFD